MPPIDPRGVIASALALPADERLALLDPIHVSLADPQVEHDLAGEDVAEVAAYWRDEIARRLDDITSGRVRTVPADEAERMIRDAAVPPV
jgi:putative addiction module component (TIGR02574 family)